MKKLISVFTVFTTILWLSGLFAVLPVKAVTFADGDLARESDEFDVYIVKLVGSEKYKRLILNPDVFNMYGHLKWSNVQVVANGELAGYATSDLVREINDEKVYQLYPDGDTGTKKWVESLDCFTTKGFDWDSVYTINSFDRDSYTTASTNLCGVEVPVGALTLSLSPDSPKAVTVPRTANGVTFMKVKVEGSGKISQLTVKRSGAGSVDDFDNVYVYQDGKRLTSGRTISSASSKVTFIGLKINAPATFDIVADISATAGNQDYFVIESASDVTADATVGGSFPIAGNALSMSGSTAGTLTVERSGSTAYNVTIGEKEVEVSQFKVTTGTEGTKLHRVQLYNSGTITTTKLINVKLKVGGTELASGEFSSDGYVVFNLATPYEIAKGNHAIFRVYADISGGKPDETVKLYLELATDILGIGTTLGYGMTPTITSYDSDTYVTATLKGGDLTLVKSGPNAANIGTKTTDTVFLELAMSAAADITVSRTRLSWCVDQGGEGTYDAADTGGFTDVEDTKITNKDTGVVWAGPHDGSAFTTATTASTGGLCPGDIAGVYKDYTDTYDLAAGSSYNLKITADVKTDNTASGNSQLGADDKIKIIWVSFPTLVGTSGNVNYVKYTNTTNAVDDSAMIPSGDIAGEEMTIKAASLAVTLAGSPSGTDSSGAIGSARKFVKSEQLVDAVGLVFTAGVASDIKVTDLTLTGYSDCDGQGTYVAGLEDTNCYVKNLISSVKIVEKESGANIYATAKGFSGTNYANVAFSGLSWTIPAGESRTLLVKSNVSSIGPTVAAGFDMISFDIDAAATDITSQDKDANDITETGNDVNGATDPNVAIALYNYGSVTVAKATDTPLQSILTMGSTNNEVSKFKLTGSVEAFSVETFSIDLDAAADRDNFTGVALKYQTEAQSGTSDWTVSSKKTFADEATLSFAFTGSARPYVPKDDSSYITALVDVDAYSGGLGADAGDYSYFAAATDTDEFKAYGAKSGYLVTSVTEPTQTDFAYHYIFRSRPVFAKKAWSGDINELARFSVTAQGYDVTFDGTDSANLGFFSLADVPVSAALEFDVIASGTDETTQIVYLYKADTNEIVSSVEGLMLAHADAVTENTNGTYTTTISFGFEEYSSAIVIAKDVTKEFYVMLDNTTDFNNQDEYLQLKLLNDQGAEGGNSSFTNCNIIWYDGSDDEGTVFEHQICMPANTRGIGDFPFSFRLLQGTAQ